MVWSIRNRVPSDQTLEDYDNRVANSESSIRRPARKINVISNEEWDRMQANKQLQHKWQERYMQEVRRRNRLVRFKLFQFFKDNYDLEGKDAALAQRAIAAVCKSITKDFLLYCQMNSMGEKESEPGQNMAHFQPIDLKEFSHNELGIRVDEDDVNAVMFATWNKTPPSQLISEQIKRDLDEVKSFETLITALNQKVPGYVGTPSDICHSVHARIEALDRENSQEVQEISQDWDRSIDDLFACYERQAKEYLGKLHKDLDGPGPSYLEIVKLTPQQVAGLKEVLNNDEQLSLFRALYTEAEWSDTLEGLKEEEKVLASIVDDDAIRKPLLEAILKAHTNSNVLVQVAATIRNETYAGDAIDNEDDFDKRYRNAVKEHAKDFTVSREYNELEKLFGLDLEVPSRGGRVSGPDEDF